MVMYLVKGSIIIALGFMIFSPKLAFRWLDKYLFEEDSPDTTVSFIDTTREPTTDSFTLDIEEKRLANIQKMIDNAPNSGARRTWEIQKAHFLRNTNWNKLVEYAGASQRC